MADKLITKSFERLLDKGKHRGFVTYEELGKSLGKRSGTHENLERAFIKRIGGNCHSAVSVMASSNGQNLSISSQIFGKNDYISLTETGLLKDGQLLLDKMVKQAEQLGGIELLNEYN